MNTVAEPPVLLETEGAIGWIRFNRPEVERVERSWRADPADGLRPLRPLRHQWSPPS